MGNSSLPSHLQGTLHWDWPWPFSKIPRAWTSFSWGVPKQIAGNQEDTRLDAKLGAQGPAPIGERGTWQVSKFPNAPGLLKYLPLYFAFTTSKGTHFRIGARWDDVDSYTTFPTAARRHYSGERVEDTSTK